MNQRIYIVIGIVVLVNMTLCGRIALASEDVSHEASGKDHGESGFELGL